ncbi:MAG: hypothetical protein C4567_04490 [Deltaproteobacteria bacterium]|nr:MAG: hypothetical protein C4567_04490 [Deltaproteobacteria bacterium]
MGLQAPVRIGPAPTQIPPQMPPPGITPGPPVVTKAAPTTAVGGPGFNFWAWLGWKKIEGQVIHIDPLYMSRPEFSWGGFLLKLLLVFLGVLILGPLVLGFVVVMVAMSLLLRLFFGGGGGGRGFFSSVASQVVGFFLTSKLIGPRAEIPTRDVRVREQTGQEHLVRIKGEIIAGNITVGDEVIVEGYDRQGTLMLSRGWNKRINSEIRVKPV